MTGDEADLVTRVAKLEARHELVKEDLDKVTEALTSINRKLDKYEGRWGGILMVVSAVATMLAIFWSTIEKRFFNGD